MARYELILRLEGALWLRIIFKPLLIPKGCKNPKVTQQISKLVGVALGESKCEPNHSSHHCKKCATYIWELVADTRLAFGVLTVKKGYRLGYAESSRGRLPRHAEPVPPGMPNGNLGMGKSGNQEIWGFEKSGIWTFYNLEI